MKLWFLERIYNDGTGKNPNAGREAYDVYDAFVIRAEDEETARKMARKAGGDDPRIWLDASLTTCQELTAEGESCIVVSDFHHG